MRPKNLQFRKSNTTPLKICDDSPCVANRSPATLEDVFLTHVSIFLFGYLKIGELSRLGICFLLFKMLTKEPN